MKSTHMSWGAMLQYIFIILVLNGVLEWISVYFGYKRYFFSIELLFSFFLAALGLRWIGGLFFILAIGAELFLGVAAILYLFDYSQIWTVIGFVFEAKQAYIFAIFLLTAVFVFLYFFAFSILKRIAWPRVLFLTVTIVLLQGSVSFREGNFLLPQLMERKNLVAGSSLFFIDNILSDNGKLYDLRSQDNVEYVPIKMPSAMMQTLEVDSNNATLPKKVLFIIAESWGLPTNKAVLESQINALRNSPSISQLTLGTVQSVGATAFAEFRELCGKLPTKLNLKNISKSDLGECWPERFKKMGYHTASVHGAHGTMYDRLNWYPSLGFEDLTFREILPLATNEDCYSFPGYCDRNLFPIVFDKLNFSDKVFVYWLTLNSHMPYDRRDVVNYRSELCQGMFGSDFSEKLCNYQNLHVQFFEGLAKFSKNKALKGVEVVVVGDHAPIFDSDDSRGNFVRNKIPFIKFTIQ